MQNPKLLVHIVGPTAIGKSAIAVNVARHFNTEVLSSDSRQFYRGLNIGTAKISKNDQKGVKHHFIDCLNIDEEYNVADFEHDVLKKLNLLFETKDLAVMTGGSGLYLHAIWFGFNEDLPPSDPELRKKLEDGYKKDGIEFLQDKLNALNSDAIKTIDANNPHRLIRSIEILEKTGKSPMEIKSSAKPRRFHQLKIGLDMDREQLYDRINQRVDNMIDSGLIDEAKKFLPYRDKNALKTVGYRELFQYFDGEISRAEAINEIKKNTRRYAKRQMTWFRRYNDITWCRAKEEKKIIEIIEKQIEQT